MPGSTDSTKHPPQSSSSLSAAITHTPLTHPFNQSNYAAFIQQTRDFTIKFGPLLLLVAGLLVFGYLIGLCLVALPFAAAYRRMEQDNALPALGLDEAPLSISSVRDVASTISYSTDISVAGMQPQLDLATSSMRADAVPVSVRSRSVYTDVKKAITQLANVTTPASMSQLPVEAWSFTEVLTVFESFENALHNVNMPQTMKGSLWATTYDAVLVHIGNNKKLMMQGVTLGFEKLGDFIKKDASAGVRIVDHILKYYFYAKYVPNLLMLESMFGIVQHEKVHELSHAFKLLIGTYSGYSNIQIPQLNENSQYSEGIQAIAEMEHWQKTYIDALRDSRYMVEYLINNIQSTPIFSVIMSKDYKAGPELCNNNIVGPEFTLLVKNILNFLMDADAEHGDMAPFYQFINDVYQNKAAHSIDGVNRLVEDIKREDPYKRAWMAFMSAFGLKMRATHYGDKQLFMSRIVHDTLHSLDMLRNNIFIEGSLHLPYFWQEKLMAPIDDLKDNYKLVFALIINSGKTSFAQQTQLFTFLGITRSYAYQVGDTHFELRDLIEAYVKSGPQDETILSALKHFYYFDGFEKYFSMNSLFSEVMVNILVPYTWYQHNLEEIWQRYRADSSVDIDLEVTQFTGMRASLTSLFLTVVLAVSFSSGPVLVRWLLDRCRETDAMVEPGVRATSAADRQIALRTTHRRASRRHRANTSRVASGDSIHSVSASSSSSLEGEDADNATASALSKDAPKIESKTTPSFNISMLEETHVKFIYGQKGKNVSLSLANMLSAVYQPGTASLNKITLYTRIESESGIRIKDKAKTIVDNLMQLADLIERHKKATDVFVEEKHASPSLFSDKIDGLTNDIFNKINQLQQNCQKETHADNWPQVEKLLALINQAAATRKHPEVPGGFYEKTMLATSSSNNTSVTEVKIKRRARRDELKQVPWIAHQSLSSKVTPKRPRIPTGSSSSHAKPVSRANEEKISDFARLLMMYEGYVVQISDFKPGMKAPFLLGFENCLFNTLHHLSERMPKLSDTVYKQWQSVRGMLVHRPYELSQLTIHEKGQFFVAISQLLRQIEVAVEHHHINDIENAVQQMNALVSQTIPADAQVHVNSDAAVALLKNSVNKALTLLNRLSSSDIPTLNHFCMQQARVQLLCHLSEQLNSLQGRPTAPYRQLHHAVRDIRNALAHPDTHELSQEQAYEAYRDRIAQASGMIVEWARSREMQKPKPSTKTLSVSSSSSSDDAESLANPVGSCSSSMSSSSNSSRLDPTCNDFVPVLSGTIALAPPNVLPSSYEEFIPPHYANVTTPTSIPWQLYPTASSFVPDGTPRAQYDNSHSR